ncbi:hypothetical protein ACVWWU_002706 [Pantoea sp. PA1]|jgi:hypothetical protein|uniref:Uncharacterized protein n=1 Tax=Pantoea ananas TaxID=553 RepID=A0A8A4KAG1_PANAN|nr:hypothetical protein [Pantoea ananatis]ERM14409.1 hypothetical protein L585_09540 [Pantoea ananatis BRT175]MCW0314803.1 hypothetical protein [Pantoea ananatis]MDH0053173.1 hypothetical protein [Pantoea ananatis]PQK89606.1 hypothetical protein CG432_13110 [Pantoea ananatis]PQL07158.1 hypothetical protein CG436_09215 [Pantoea ananatis]
MSIDIACYTSINVDELKERLDVVRTKYDHLFDGPYLMFEPRTILSRQQLELIDDRIEKYNQETKLLIAEEFGLKKPKSYFLIAVNDKSFPELDTSGIADVFRQELGEENIVVLLNGEDLI